MWQTKHGGSNMTWPPLSPQPHKYGSLGGCIV